MGTMIRVLIATSLLFVLAECSLKYDTKWNKKAFIAGQENDLEYVGDVGEAPENKYLCYWDGSAPVLRIGAPRDTEAWQELGHQPQATSPKILQGTFN
ncbi:hypothetical protein PMAYCL1PPCAC_27049, partial [Pristionchus mayeri]